jgi:NADH-quinone oxidoreductase subunit C
MTVALRAEVVAQKVVQTFPAAAVTTDKDAIVVPPESLFQVAQYLKNTPGLDFEYLTCLTAVDYTDYFEVVYHLTSLNHNHSLVMKTRCYDREKPVVPSMVSLWQGADLQEREAYDLMGIVFSGHPNLKRLFLWESFPGHPLRRDYL